MENTNNNDLEQYEAELDSDDPATLRRLLQEYKQENMELHATIEGMSQHAACRKEETTQMRLELEEKSTTELGLRIDVAEWKSRLQKATDELFEAQNVHIPNLERQNSRLQRQTYQQASLREEERVRNVTVQATISAKRDEAMLQSQNLTVELQNVRDSHIQELQELNAQLSKHKTALGGVKEIAAANDYAKVVSFMEMNNL